MTINQAIADYLKLAEFFNLDYGSENEVLSSFKAVHPSLTGPQATDLVDVLRSESDWNLKFFVADLLYLYPDFPEVLIEPMLQCAVTYQDPSFDRIFLRPCVKRVGVAAVVKRLVRYLEEGTARERMGVTWLSYHIRGSEPDKAILREAMERQSSMTTNPVELYHCKLRLDKDQPRFSGIPDDADGLVQLVKGKPELEDFLFNQLGWSR
jgi:hypothetical protein